MMVGNFVIRLTLMVWTTNLKSKFKKICVVTGTRAEYGLLSPLMHLIKNDSCIELYVIATGSHLSPEFGLTSNEIINDGFKIDKKVEMVLSADTHTAITKSTGLGMIGFADAIEDLKPDLIILLGDRYELLAASFAALNATIPIAHIHGGETTEGAIDESIRHSITKMSWFHFTANDVYASRVIQLGENPNRVFNVGGLGVDLINKSKLLEKKELIKKTGIRFSKKNVLVTYHPVTLEKASSESDFKCILSVLREMSDLHIIFTMPNSDSDSRDIFKMIEEFVSDNAHRSIAFTSMGHLHYLSTLKYVDGVIGNSSSGIAEAPSFKIGTVNIGDRQKGRLKSSSVIDCKATKIAIKKAIEMLYSKDFRKNLKSSINPYGDGNASEKIFKILKNEPKPKNIKKSFYNL